MSHSQKTFDGKRGWQPGFPVRERHVSETLLVGDFRCAGERRGWAPEQAHHAEIALQTEGTHVFEVGRKRHLVDGASVFVHPAGQEYRRASPTPLPQRSTHLFLGGALEGALDRLRGPHAMPSTPEVAMLLRQTFAAEPGLAVEEAALRLAGAVLSEVARRGALPALPERASWRRLAEAVQHELATRFTERLTLAELGRSCGASPFHLCRVFRAVTGETVHRHLTRLRLRAALIDLDNGDRDLAGLARRLGFSSHSHFTGAFHREYRIAPSLLISRRSGHARSPAPR